MNNKTTFDALKQAITREPILHLPLDDLPYKIEVDGSLVAMGAVLLQQQQQQWKIVAFFQTHTNQLNEIIP